MRADRAPAGRDGLIDGFLTGAGWADAVRLPLAGDASARRYLRLLRGAERAILMDAPPGQADDPADFVAIGTHLASLGLSPPRVLAQDLVAGFLLLEDLGDGVFARLIADDPAREGALYAAATDVLLHLQAHPAPPGLPDLSAADWAEAAGLAVDAYAGAVLDATSSRAALVDTLAEALARHADGPRVLILRDYHAENLMWLPQRVGLAAVGLLDFQLGQMGQPGYDLVSLVQDARRDVTGATAKAAVTRFRDASGAAGFDTAFAVLGAQRALRILGVFARLATAAGKPQYLALIPRVWGQLQDNLAHPALARLARVCAAALPAPTTATLDRIARACLAPLMLFAAGFGTRMGALTATRPKPLIEVAGRALIDHALDLARGAGAAPVVVNLHYRGEMLAAHLAGQDVALSWERARILDTGGGLRAALPLLGPGAVFTLNADGVFGGDNPLTALERAWDGARMGALLSLLPAARGDFTMDAAGRLARARGGPGYRYLGAQIIDPAGLAGVEEEVFSLNLIWDRLIAEGRAFGLLHQGGWCDVGHPEGIAEAEALLAGVSDVS